MRDRIVLVMAKRAGRWIAGAINFIGSHTLFGRHWGAIEHHPFLHFELCYYQAIDYAIAHKMPRVEAGAQGEHKISRGYMPTTTYSAHYIADPGLRRAIADYLVRERAYVAAVGAELAALGPVPQGFRRRARMIKLAAENAETAMPSYDANNIFAKILRGEMPAHKVFEDDNVFAFLDIMPRAPGHTLVIPKSPARTILDIAPDDLAHVMIATQKVARAAMAVFAADGLTIQQFNEPAGGQVVFHLHVHVMPRKIGVPLKPPASVREDPAVLSDQALKLAAALKGWRKPAAAENSARTAARNALDLGAHQALDHAGQVVVEPRLQHRPKHFVHQILKRPGVLHQHGLRERIECGIDRGAGFAGHKLPPLPR